MGKHINSEKRDEVIRLAREGLRQCEISERTGLSSGTAWYVIHRGAKTILRQCDHCGRTIKDGEASFCPYCGKKILTDADRISSRLSDITAAVSSLPNGCRDRVLANAAEIRSILKRMEAKT